MFAETCPQYLYLSADRYEAEPDVASRYICAPPLRDVQHHEELWAGLQGGYLQVVSTDHCPFEQASKNAGLAGGGWSDFTQIPGGLPGIEARLALVYQRVVDREMSLERWVDLCCTTPARIFGLYPTKGCLEEGSDADLVVFDPNAERPLVPERLHSKLDYSVYEDVVVRGWPRLVYSRGEVVADNGTPVGEPGRGNFIRKGTIGRPNMSRYHFNQQVTTLEPPGGDPRAFHRKLPGYEASPMVQARDIAESLGLGAVWVKNEFSRLDLPSFKILGASWGTYRALDERIGGFDEWATLDDLKVQLGGRFSLSAATDGNHGRAVARMGKLLGLPASIYVPAGTADARIEGHPVGGRDRARSSKGVMRTPLSVRLEDASDDCLVISDTSWEGYQDVPRWVIEGYSTIFNEVDEQLPEAPDVVFVQMGVGALGVRGRPALPLEAGRSPDGRRRTGACRVHPCVDGGG